MAIITTTQSSDANIVVNDVQVGTFHADTDQNGNANVTINVTNPEIFYATDEAATNVHSLLDNAITQAKANIKPTE